MPLAASLQTRSASCLVLFVLLVFVSGLSWPGETRASTLCRMACKKGSGSCKVVVPEKGPDAIELDPSNYRTFEACDQARVEGSGTTILNYVRDRQWFRPPEPVDGPVAPLLARYKPDPCASSTPECTQARMEGGTRPMTGASGIDPRVAQPAGQGRPCALGFPCGRIAIPPPAWRFRVVDTGLAGNWTARLVRGKADAKGDTLVGRIDRGIVTADGRWFGPSNRYSYTVADAGGRVIASGEFSVSSQSDMDLLRSIARGKADVADGIAWSDTLMENDMTWDAMQESLAEAR